MNIFHEFKTFAMRGNAIDLAHGVADLYMPRPAVSFFKNFGTAHFKIQEEDGHFLTVARYVERNALRARLVEHALDWRWCSLWTAT